MILGKSMNDHLRFAACYWHNFCRPGSDVFGSGTSDRPWLNSGDAMEMAMMKADHAFEFFSKSDVPY
jgi:xylose isomerase